MSSAKDIYRVRILPLEAMARTALDAPDGDPEAQRVIDAFAQWMELADPAAGRPLGALSCAGCNAFFDEARAPEAVIILDTGEGAKGCVVTALCARCADDADTAARRWVRTICDDVEIIDPAREEGHS
jgi:hypothetical protein